MASRKKRIVSIDGIIQDKITLGQKDKTTELESTESDLQIHKPIVVEGNATVDRATQDEHAVNLGQLEERITDIIDIIKNGTSPFVDIPFTPDSFTLGDDGEHKLLISKELYGYDKAVVGTLGRSLGDDSFLGVTYTPTILANGDIEISVQVDPFNGFVRLILGGLDPNYIDFANQFAIIFDKIADLQDQIDESAGSLSLPTFSKTIAKQDWILDQSSGSYYFSITQAEHEFDDPYILSIGKTIADGREDFVYTLRISNDNTVTLVVDEPIECRVILSNNVVAPTDPKVYIKEITEDDWVPAGASFKYVIYKSEHHLDDPYVASLLKVVEDHSESCVFSFRVYIDQRVVVYVDERINCKICIRSK